MLETFLNFLWSQLEQYDNWYRNDIILQVMSHMFSLDVIDDTAKLIWKD